MSSQRTTILGVEIDNLNAQEAMFKVEELLLDGRQRYIVTPNPEFLVRAQKDKHYKQLLNNADLSIPDGTGLIYASRFLGRPLKERITGVDLMEKICQRAAQKKWQVLLHGAGHGVAEKAAQKLKRKYSGLKINKLQAADKDISTVLFVALGSPKQEKWIDHHLKRMPHVDLAVGVGGAFDFISEDVKRAPLYIQNAGMEWLWRFVHQPWRIGRIYRAVVEFPYLVLKERLTK